MSQVGGFRRSSATGYRLYRGRRPPLPWVSDRFPSSRPPFRGEVDVLQIVFGVLQENPCTVDFYVSSVVGPSANSRRACRQVSVCLCSARRLPRLVTSTPNTGTLSGATALRSVGPSAPALRYASYWFLGVFFEAGLRTWSSCLPRLNVPKLEYYPNGPMKYVKTSELVCHLNRSVY